MNKRIRFINSNYDTLFWIEDGDEVVVTNTAGETATFRCHFIDEYHFDAENSRGFRNCCHICQWAESMEKNGHTYAPVAPSYNLYQLDYNKGDYWEKRHQLSLEQLTEAGMEVEQQLYRLSYSEALGYLQKKGDKATLAAIFRKFKDRKKCPEDFSGRALSTSDVVVLMVAGKQKAYYRDPNGFVKISW